VGKINIPRVVEVLRQEFLESSDGGLERVTFNESQILDFQTTQEHFFRNDLLSPIKYQGILDQPHQILPENPARTHKILDIQILHWNRLPRLPDLHPIEHQVLVQWNKIPVKSLANPDLLLRQIAGFQAADKNLLISAGPSTNCA
jgi:hypothetical protein